MSNIADLTKINSYSVHERLEGQFNARDIFVIVSGISIAVALNREN